MIYIYEKHFIIYMKKIHDLCGKKFMIYTKKIHDLFEKHFMIYKKNKQFMPIEAISFLAALSII